MSADSNKILKDVQKRNEAWFKIFKDSCVPRLVMQQKWFKNERDLAVGDLVFFRKDNSELGEGDWTVGMVDQVIPSKDKLIRQVIIKYRNSSEDFDTLSKRNPRKCVRLCNVDDSGLWDDLSWVQKQIESVDEAVLPDVSNATIALPVSDGCEVPVKCKLCCCVSHCQVRFHSMSKKPMVDIPIVNMMFGLEDDVVFRGLPGADL